ncbi:DUF1365 family protein [Streptomyces sp. NPDC006012]|uniref:DUF1365 family protein n=1 Tax=Streptomyces sp. NPDC006012 TaxID=3364739 RepID=UPI0036CFB0E6
MLPLRRRGRRRAGSALVTAVPVLCPCPVAHERTGPRRYVLRHRTYPWLLDPGRPPRLPSLLRPLARFHARDHFTGDRPSIRVGLDDFLAAHDGRQSALGPGSLVLGRPFSRCPA